MLVNIAHIEHCHMYVYIYIYCVYVLYCLFIFKYIYIDIHHMVNHSMHRHENMPVVGGVAEHIYIYYTHICSYVHILNHSKSHHIS